MSYCAYCRTAPNMRRLLCTWHQLEQRHIAIVHDGRRLSTSVEHWYRVALEETRRGFARALPRKW